MLEESRTFGGLGHPLRTRAEVAAIMTGRGFPMSSGNVYETEKRVFRKLRKLLAVQELAIELFPDLEGTFE